MNTVQLNINLTFQQLIDAVRQLTPKERMEVNEAIWDENMSIPIEHQTLVLSRIEKSKKDPSRLSNWDEALKRLRP